MFIKHIVSEKAKYTKAIIEDFTTIYDEVACDINVRPLAFILDAMNIDFNSARTVKIEAGTKCVDPDTYDSMVGVDIAESKAFLKYHRAMSKDYTKIINKLEFYLDSLKKKKAFHDKKCDRIEDNLNSRYMPK